MFDHAAVEILDAIFSHACRASRIDEEASGTAGLPGRCSSMPARTGTSGVVRLGEQATAEDLTTITAGDLQAAYQELTDNRIIGTPGESAGAATLGTAAGLRLQATRPPR